MNVKLIAVTPNPEAHMAFCARVSGDQSRPDYDKFFASSYRRRHWSVFESASMTIEITTSIAIATQILRHRASTFQQLSRRYCGDKPTFEIVRGRRQDTKDRQNSTDDLSDEDRKWFHEAICSVEMEASYLYQQAISRGIAKESARFLLPQFTQTTLYMTSNIRNWIHYLQSRLATEAQLEHREVAREIRIIFAETLPSVARAAGLDKED